MNCEFFLTTRSLRSLEAQRARRENLKLTPLGITRCNLKIFTQSLIKLLKVKKLENFLFIIHNYKCTNHGGMHMIDPSKRPADPLINAINLTHESIGKSQNAVEKFQNLEAKIKEITKETGTLKINSELQKLFKEVNIDFKEGQEFSKGDTSQLLGMIKVGAMAGNLQTSILQQKETDLQRTLAYNQQLNASSQGMGGVGVRGRGEMEELAGALEQNRAQDEKQVSMAETLIKELSSVLSQIYK